MPTILSHAAIPIAAAMILGRERIALPIVAVGVALSMLPDADVASFLINIDYANAWGHRGATHSLVAAAVTACLATMILRPKCYVIAFAYLFVAIASHGLLDMLTDGGLGAALFWPWSEARHFAPFRPISVSPIGAAFFSARGLAVLWSEVLWIWLPVMTFGLSIMGLRHFSLARARRSR
jgi:inner membrane protein